LGWHWGGISAGLWVWIIIGVIVTVYLIMILLPVILPDTQTTPFAHILKASPVAKYLIVGLAVLTAPFVEELIYRGMLYSGLRSQLPVWVSVVIVSMVFALVHMQQYWGAWSSFIALTTLSFFLTIIRANTKSLLPCVVVHQVFNTISGSMILLGFE